MTRPAPALKLIQARQSLFRAHTHLVAALKLIDAQPFYAFHRTAIEGAITDNLISRNYLGDIIRNLNLAVPAKPL